MPLIEVSLGTQTESNSLKPLKSSCWRKLAGFAAFIQLTFFLFVTLVLVSAAIIQLYTGVAPFQPEIFHTIHSGVFVTTLHHDIMAAHNYGIFGPSHTLIQETVERGIVQKGVSLSNELKIELEEANWGTIFTIFVISAVIAAIQCWRGAQLLRASWKWKNPTRALALMERWRLSMIAFRNYLFGFLISILLFGTDVPGIVALLLAVLWMALCLISASTYGYHKELSMAVLHTDDEDV